MSVCHTLSAPTNLLPLLLLYRSRGERKSRRKRVRKERGQSFIHGSLYFCLCVGYLSTSVCVSVPLFKTSSRGAYWEKTKGGEGYYVG